MATGGGGDLTVDDFDFPLPVDRVALRPVSPRDSARLLVVPPGEAPFVETTVRNLPDLLAPGDALVFNDTRVLPVRLVGTRTRLEAVARIEATLHTRLSAGRWLAFVRPAKRLRQGETILFRSPAEIDGSAPPGGASLAALAAGHLGEGEFELELDCGGEAGEMAALADVGAMPLPPYIAGRRSPDARDAEDYQTVYARVSGSVAAPTAGLHFTPDLLARLAARGVPEVFVTLHVGAGTFLPVKAERIADHRMHAEYGEVSEEAAEVLARVRESGGRIVAVGTTAMRLLESAADEEGRIRPFAGETSIFITPGYRFRAVDGLMTNFHLPRSTLMMLVSAFSGIERIRSAYAHAIREGYRFFSYGDASLLWPAVPSVARTRSGRP